MADEQFTDISFYVVAHADDWQLFMQPNACKDLMEPGSKVVFIITTAGDAGAIQSYWAAREEGLKSSIRFCLAPLAILSQDNGTREFNNHSVSYWAVNNATCYFLRLPDGNLDANGFSANYHQSLSKLRTGQINTINAIDNSALYLGWVDFYTTLQKIIRLENQGTANIWINYINPNTIINPNDHPDHIATGQAIQSMTNISDVKQALFVGYNVGNAPGDLHQKDLFWKAGMFAAYEKAVFDGSGYSTLKESMDTYLRWCLTSPDFVTIIP